MEWIHVVIPVYNAFSFLHETVTSVLNQPYKEIDIVLVDDGSNDGSSELCDEIARVEERVTAIHQPNSGVSVARNRGIEHFLHNSVCGYIAFLDADDLWCPNVFTGYLLDELKNEQADVIGFSSCSSNSGATKFKVLNKYANETKLLDEKYQMEFLWVKGHFAAHLYNITLFKENRIFFDPLSKQNEDVIFSAKMLFCSRKITLFAKVLYVYRTNIDSVTHTTQYSLDNACNIPDSWYRAKNFFDRSDDIPREAKKKWDNFCKTTSSIRCLEVIRILTANGYSKREIDDCFCNKSYYRNIKDLPEDALAEWQRNDLKMYRNNELAFYRHFRRRGYKYRVRRFVLRVRPVRRILEAYRYTASMDEISRVK